jgi:hypothetical protein
MTKKIATAEVSFHFEAEVTQADYDKVVKRVQLYINGTDLDATASFFFSRREVRAFISYDITDENEYKVYDYLGKRLKTLIDWHKEAATYGWNHTSITQAATIQKVSA